jgi:hypothetical protein
MIDVRPEVLIRASRHAVAAFMFDPANDLKWTGGITDSRPAQPGLLKKGDTVERDAKFLGRSFTYGYVITAAVPDELVEMKVEKPFPMLVRYELSDDPEGTRAAIHSRGEAAGFFKLAGPLMQPQVEKSIRADLERLKAAIEGA